MTSVARRTWRVLAGVAAALLILLAVIVGAFRLALGQVPEYRAQIAAWLSDRVRLDVEVGELDARLRLHGPELTFEDVVVRSTDGTVTLATARRGSVALDLVDSLRTGRLMAGRFELQGPELALLRRSDGRLRLVGQESLRSPTRSTGVNLDRLPTGTLIVTDAKLSFVDETRADAPIRVFDAVSLELERSARRMTARGRGTLPRDLGQEITFEARSSGPLSAPRDLAWQFELATGGLDLAGLRALLPAEWPLPATGTADVNVSGALEGATVMQLRGELRIDRARFDLPTWATGLPGPASMAQPPDHPQSPGTRSRLEAAPARPDPGRFRAPEAPTAVQFALMKSRFEFERHAQGGTVRLEGFELEGDAGHWRPASIELAWTGRPAADFTLAGQVSHAAPAAVWPLLAYAPESAALARARAVEPQGELDDVVFTFARDQDQVTTYSASGRFRQVATRAVDKVPAIAGLSGKFQASEFGGRVELEPRELTADLPRWFLQPIRVGLLQGAITWRRMSEGWRVLSDELTLQSPDGQARGSFELTVPLDGSSPVLDAVATVKELDAAALRAYLPVGRLRPRSVAWLSQAFIRGTAATAELVYHGPVRSFPFAGGEGEFDVRVDAVGVTLSYQPGWPVLSEAAGTIVIHNAGLSAQITSGRVGDLEVERGEVSIPSLKEPVIAVTAAGGGELHEALGYLKSSPPAEDLGEALQRVEARGKAKLALELEVPVRRPAETRFTVQVGVDDASVTLTGQPLVASNLQGQLAIIDGGFATDRLEGRLLGGPFSLTATVERAAAGVRPRSTFTAQGTVRGDDLVQTFAVPDRVSIDGETSWRLDGAIEGGPRRTPLRQRYALRSDLAGLAIGLPAPLAKPLDRAEPVNVEFDFDGERIGLVRASTGRGRAIARIERVSPGEWRFDRGAVRYDGRGVALPDHPGLRVEGNIERLDLDEWLALRPDEAPSHWRLRDVLNAATVHVDRLGVWGYELEDVRAILQRQPEGWQIDVAGPHARGRIVAPFAIDGDEAVVAELDTLSLPARGQRESQERRAGDPHRFAAVHARVGDLTYDRYHLGEVRLETSRAPDGIKLESLSAQGTSYTAELSGSWLAVPGGTETALDFTLTSTSVAETLAEFGYTNAVTGTRAFLRGDLRWPGPPEHDALERASGILHVEVEDGQVLNVEPGAGRVLGLLSLASLPRRLALDFSDLTDKGLAFDSITGDFELSKGVAFTDNLLLRGPAAEVGIAGRTNLASREYDQTAVVTGDLGASLGVAGALAGGPAIGAALLLFSQIFKEPLKGITRGYYRISGPWDDPVIERVITGESQSEARAAQVPEPEPRAPVETD